MPNLPNLNSVAPPKQVQKTPTSPVKPASPPAHAQLLDVKPAPENFAFYPNLIEKIKENPFTASIPEDSMSRSENSWKTHIGVAVISFFLGAAVGIILMLYLY